MALVVDQGGHSGLCEHLGFCRVRFPIRGVGPVDQDDRRMLSGDIRYEQSSFQCYILTRKGEGFFTEASCRIGSGSRQHGEKDEQDRGTGCQAGDTAANKQLSQFSQLSFGNKGSWIAVAYIPQLTGNAQLEKPSRGLGWSTTAVPFRIGLPFTRRCGQCGMKAFFMWQNG